MLPALWVAAEWLRGWAFSGFPWLALGYAQLGTPLAGYAPVLGVYGVSLAVAVTAGALATVVLGTKRERIVAVVVALVAWGGGALLTQLRWTQPLGAPVQVALVQGAVPQSMKWQPELYVQTLAQNLALFAMAFYGKPIIYRTTDLKSNEYRNLGVALEVRTVPAAGGSSS